MSASSTTSADENNADSDAMSSPVVLPPSDVWIKHIAPYLSSRHELQKMRISFSAELYRDVAIKQELAKQWPSSSKIFSGVSHQHKMVTEAVVFCFSPNSEWLLIAQTPPLNRPVKSKHVIVNIKVYHRFKGLVKAIPLEHPEWIPDKLEFFGVQQQTRTTTRAEDRQFLLGIVYQEDKAEVGVYTVQTDTSDLDNPIFDLTNYREFSPEVPNPPMTEEERSGCGLNLAPMQTSFSKKFDRFAAIYRLLESRVVLNENRPVLSGTFLVVWDVPSGKCLRREGCPKWWRRLVQLIDLPFDNFPSNLLGPNSCSFSLWNIGSRGNEGEALRANCILSQSSMRRTHMAQHPLDPTIFACIGSHELGIGLGLCRTIDIVRLLREDVRIWENQDVSRRSAKGRFAVMNSYHVGDAEFDVGSLAFHPDEILMDQIKVYTRADQIDSEDPELRLNLKVNQKVVALVEAKNPANSPSDFYLDFHFSPDGTTMFAWVKLWFPEGNSYSECFLVTA